MGGAEEGWRVFLAVAGFSLLGFMVSRHAGSGWGVGVGVFGYACYMLGYMLGWTFGNERRR
jgi:hypothetical protein